MNERELRENGELYHPFRIKNNPWNAMRKACKEFNDSEFWDDKTALENMKKLFARSSDDMVLTVPFYCDLGENIYFGKKFYANTNLVILDEAKVVFGDNVFLGPNVNIFTATHPIDKEVRRLEYEKALEVQIGNDVWIGGNTVVNPGVTIGNDVVIGSGSVVTKDIPSGVVAAGNPCKIIREITDDDREYWHGELEKYNKKIDKE